MRPDLIDKFLVMMLSVAIVALAIAMAIMVGFACIAALKFGLFGVIAIICFALAVGYIYTKSLS